jgi:hypothetical protein
MVARASGVRDALRVAIIGEPSEFAMPPLDLFDPVVDAEASLARALACAAGRVVSVNASSSGTPMRAPATG